MKNIYLAFCLLFGAVSLSAQTYLQENFDNGIPGTWVQETVATDGGWLGGGAAALSSAFFPIPDNGTNQVMASNDDGCNCDKISDRIILPALDFTGASVVILQFNSFYNQGSYGGATESCFVEVSTDAGASWTQVQELPVAGDWVNNTLVSLDAYADMSDVLVSFHYSDGGGWTYGVAVDEIVIYSPLDFDVKVDRYVGQQFEELGVATPVAAEVTNFGLQELNSFDFTWSDGTNTYTENVSGLSLAFGESTIITHGEPFLINEAISYDIDLFAENPNGQMDGNMDNNSAYGSVAGVTYIPGKKMLVEEATGTWCGWCPRGWEWMDFMAENYPDEFIGIAVHNGDPMAVTAYDDGLTSFPGFSGFPSVVVDRGGVFDPSAIETLLPASLEKIAPIAPAVTNAVMDVETMSISLEAGIEFVTQLNNIDYSVNMILAESGVTGSGNGWDQANYYSGSGNDPIPNFGIDWNESPATVSADLLEYNHVGRWLSDGWAGEAGLIPSSVVAGDVISKAFTGAFDTEWNPFHMEAIVIVTDNATGEVLNANAEHVEVVCPVSLDYELTINPTPGSTMEGTIQLDLDNPEYGFGGYTYTLNTGETADVGTPIEGLGNGTYMIAVTDRIGCSFEIEATIEDAVGVRDIEALTSLNVAPNPASEFARVNASFSESVDLTMTLINNIGQVVDVNHFNKTTQLQHDINVRDLPAGLYMVKLNVGNQVRTQRLVID